MHSIVLKAIRYPLMNSYSILTFVQEELDLSAPNKAAMLSLPLEKKWQIWTSRRGTDQADTNLSNNPEDYTDRLRDIGMVSYYLGLLTDHYGLYYVSPFPAAVSHK